MQVEDVDSDAGSSCASALKTASSDRRRDSQLPKAVVSIAPWVAVGASRAPHQQGQEVIDVEKAKSSAYADLVQRQILHSQAVPGSHRLSSSPSDASRRRSPGSPPETLYRLPPMPKTATERLTDTQRARLRNGDPEEVFRESSRQMRLVPLHSDKASMPRHLLEHRRHVVVSGSSLTGDLTTWSGVSDESLSVRFVPARVAHLYTAGNAMRQCHQRIVDRRRRSGSPGRRTAGVSKGSRGVSRGSAGLSDKSELCGNSPARVQTSDDEAEEAATGFSSLEKPQAGPPISSATTVDTIRTCSRRGDAAGSRPATRNSISLRPPWEPDFARASEAPPQQRQRGQQRGPASDRKRLQRSSPMTPGLVRHKKQVERGRRAGESVPPTARAVLFTALSRAQAASGQVPQRLKKLLQALYSLQPPELVAEAATQAACQVQAAPPTSGSVLVPQQQGAAARSETAAEDENRTKTALSGEAVLAMLEGLGVSSMRLGQPPASPTAHSLAAGPNEAACGGTSQVLIVDEHRPCSMAHDALNQEQRGSVTPDAAGDAHLRSSQATCVARAGEAGETGAAVAGVTGDQVEWGEAEEEESAASFARLSRSKLLALVGEVLLGRDLYLACVGSPQQWLFARVSPHKFNQVMDRVAREICIEPAESEDDETELPGSREAPAPSLRRRGAASPHGPHHEAASASVTYTDATLEEAAKIVEMARFSRDPATGKQAPVKGAAEQCRVDKQLRLTLFLNGYSYKAVRHIMRRAVHSSFPPADARACSPAEQQALLQHVMEDNTDDIGRKVRTKRQDIEGLMRRCLITTPALAAILHTLKRGQARRSQPPAGLSNGIHVLVVRGGLSANTLPVLHVLHDRVFPRLRQAAMHLGGALRFEYVCLAAEDGGASEGGGGVSMGVAECVEYARACASEALHVWFLFVLDEMEAAARLPPRMSQEAFQSLLSTTAAAGDPAHFARALEAVYEYDQRADGGCYRLKNSMGKTLERAISLLEKRSVICACPLVVLRAHVVAHAVGLAHAHARTHRHAVTGAHTGWLPWCISPTSCTSTQRRRLACRRCGKWWQSCCCRAACLRACPGWLHGCQPSPSCSRRRQGAVTAVTAMPIRVMAGVSEMARGYVSSKGWQRWSQGMFCAIL